MKNDFSKQFRPILEVAYAEAQNFSSSAILSEHFVLAALRNKDGYAFKILRQLQVPVEEMTKELEDYLPEPKCHQRPQLFLTNSLKSHCRLSAIFSWPHPKLAK